MSIDFTGDEVATLHTALVQYQSHLGPSAASTSRQVAKLMKKLLATDPDISFDRRAGKSKAKDEVKAPAVPAVDWATAEPKKKAKAIPMPGGQVLETPKPAADRPVPKNKAARK